MNTSTTNYGTLRVVWSTTKKTRKLNLRPTANPKRESLIESFSNPLRILLQIEKPCNTTVNPDKTLLKLL